jgi:formamidopyrimidine-DNA glycosylase
MPELPEVEIIVQELQTVGLIGKKITDVAVFWPPIVEPLYPEVFCNKLKGQLIRHILRRGKWIEIQLTHQRLFIHLRMTGKLLFRKLSDDILHERLRLKFDDNSVLQYEDQRKFGRWRLILEGEGIPEIGLDPLSEIFTWEYFETLLKNHRQRIKPLLLNQKYIAGLGNIYVDEALWEARVHPMKLCNQLTSNEMKNLFLAIPKVLMKGIENRGTSLGNHRSNYFSAGGNRGKNQHQLNVFRREGQPCSKCKNKIIKCVVSQRGTHFCSGCQKL